MVTMFFLFACATALKTPVVHEISFHGNGGYWSDTNDENLRSAMQQKANQSFAFVAPDLWMAPFEESVLQEDAKRIEIWYAHHGYFQARLLGWDISEYPAVFSSRPHLSIQGIIDEGEPARVRSIRIEGDVYESLLRILKQMQTIEVGDSFSLEDVEYWEEEMLTFLRERSYAQPQIKTDIRVWPNACTDLLHHQGECLVANLEAYCQKDCHSLIQRIKNCHEERGCLDLVPYQEYMHKEEKTVVDLRYTISLGSSYRFGEIRLQGNTTVPLEAVLDKILIEADLTPGSNYQIEKIYRAQESIYNMGVFSLVNITPVYEEDTELVHLNVELAETSFADINAGIGAETDTGNVGINFLGEMNHTNLWNRLMQIRWKNELGYAWRPQNIGTDNFQLQHGFVGTSQLRFLIPNLYRSLLSFDGILFSEWGLRPSYQFGFVAINPSFTYLLPIAGQKTNFCTIRLGYELSYRFYFQEDPSLLNTLQPYVLSSIQQEIVLDGRDKVLYTSGGQYLSLLLERSQPFLGAVPSFHRISFEHRMFGLLDSIYELPWGKKKLRTLLLEKGQKILTLPITMAFRWSGGILLPFSNTSGDIPFDDRFVLGGGSDVRGWTTFHLGPYICQEGANCVADGVQLSTETIPQGGLLRLFGNLEARYYTPSGYGLVLFWDAGQVWASMSDVDLGSVEHSVGMGVRYKSSIGPFRLDVARRLGDNPLFLEEPRWAFHLALSESF